MKKDFKGLEKEVRKEMAKWLEERFQYAQDNWTEITVDITNVD